ncbi:MAG: J domain-containing protein [Helicobacteraceae bacterium]|nr:J domain-containing protein [Helicobacteraceae bacterium]
MRVEALSRFVQISIEEHNPLLPKFLNYAKKHFQKQYHLSSSILILDDGERFKKDYLINWAYYSSMQSQEQDENNLQSSFTLESILEMSYLPIRIKITSTQSILECVRISFRMIGVESAVLSLDKPNHIAKRYLGALLSNIIISSDLSNIYLDSRNANFWAMIMNIIGNKIIHNVRLEFDYDSFKPNGKKSQPSYMTRKEQNLSEAYRILGCSHSDSFFDIRAKYLELIKKYHPDKVFGQNEEVIKAYNIKFIELKEAFDIIKSSFEIAS